MKKIQLLIVIWSMISFSEVFAQKPVYIYRNEGFIQTFLTEEIDSITYNRVGADNPGTGGYVTEIHACDSVYRIPVESIDSISFVTPSTILQPGVFNIDEKLREWVTGREDLTFYLNPSTPAGLLPKKGEIVVSLASENSPLKGFFMGEVSDTKSGSENITIECEPTSFEEAFVRFYGTTNGIQTESPNSRSRAGEYDQGWKLWNPEETKINLFSPLITIVSYEPDDKLAFSADENPELSFSIKPKIKYHASVIFDKPYGVSFSLSMIGDYNLQQKFKLSGNIELSDELSVTPVTIPFAGGLADFFVEIGIYGKASLGVSMDKQWNQKYQSYFHWDWSKKAPALKTVNSFKCVDKSQEGNFAINGNLSTGVFISPGVKFIATKDLDIAEVNLRFEAGIGIGGSFLPSKSDTIGAKTSTKFYNRLTNEKLEVYGEFGAQAKAKAFKWSVTSPPEIAGIPMGPRVIWNKISLVPDFNNIELKKNDGDIVSVKADAKGYVGNVDLGFALAQDSIFHPDDYIYTHRKYRGPNVSLSYSYTNKPSNLNYTVYPLVKWMGIEMIANPACPIVGTWRYKSDSWIDTLTFNSDGTWTQKDNSSDDPIYYYGTYTIDYERQIVYKHCHGGSDGPFESEFYFRVEGDLLYLVWTDGDDYPSPYVRVDD